MKSNNVISKRIIYIDNCAIDRFAALDIDPIQSLDGSEFNLATTPDLLTEYLQASANLRIEPKAKALAEKLSNHTQECGIFGFGGSPYSGFGHGYFASPETIETLQSIPIKDRPGKPIPKSQTDAFLLALSAGNIVITNDEQNLWKKRPFRGIVFFSAFEHAYKSGTSLSDFLRKIDFG